MQVCTGTYVADPVVLETLIRAEHRATMAAADFTAIEHVLDREIDVDTLRLAGNFDAVAKGRHGAARPARSTVLRDVLVPAHGAVVDTIFIAPGASCSLVHTSFRRRAPSAQTRKRGANSCCVEENSCLIGTAGRDSHDSDREYDELHMHHDRSALCFGSSFESGFLYGKFKVAPLMALLISSLRAWSIW